MRYNKDDANELISSNDSNPIEFYAVIAVLPNDINIFDAAFPDEEQANKYKHEEQPIWEENVDESAVLIVRKAAIDLK